MTEKLPPLHYSIKEKIDMLNEIVEFLRKLSDEETKEMNRIIQEEAIKTYPQIETLRRNGLSTRTVNALINNDVTNVYHLTNYKKYDLLKFRNFGKNSLDECENIMEKFNLQFRK